jgi:hypothetical protein
MNSADGPRRGYAAAGALAAMGPDVLRAVPSAADELMAALGGSADGEAVLLGCLPQIAPQRRDVFEIAVRRAKPGPPDMRSVEGHSQYQYDATMHYRGVAIEAMRHFPAFADEALPVLIDAIDTFEEYDPDWGYDNGEHGRVVHVLSKLPPAAAAAAVPALLPHLRSRRDGEIDWRIIRFFGELGTAAAEALPALRRLLDETGGAGEGADPAAPTPQCEPLEWAIWRVSGADERA